MSSITESVTLLPDPRAAGAARRLTGRLCTKAGLSSDLRETCVLLTSEAVTNAVLHGRSPVRVTVSAGPVGVRVEVGDDNSRLPVLHAHPDPDALNGRGILLIDAFATSWGVLPDRYGKVIWFEVQAS
ncbi:MAG: ATP-binding region ATPase domain protein [Frankiales bacterium]|nr:ATP-binding region ATPase domain protein [Frankiales bacterium]